MDPVTLGALITTGGSLVGKLLGGGGSETTSTIDYKALRRAAEKGGFNPLTALRAGGGAGFTTTHQPAFASGEFIADALAGVGNVVAQIDPMRDATAKLEHDLKLATLANIQADTAARLHATRSVAGAPVSTGARAISVTPAMSSGMPVRPTPETPTATNPYPRSSGMPINPDIPDAAAAEERYGDVAGSLWGIGVGIADFVHSFRNSTVPKGFSQQKFYAPGLAAKPVKSATSAPWRPPSLATSRGW